MSLRRPWARVLLTLLTVAACLIAAPAARAQGLLVDARPDQRFRLPRPWRHPRPEPPPASYKIEKLEVDVRLQDQVARVQTSQTFVNTGSRQIEATFVFPLPYDGAIDRLTLLVDGKEYAAKLLSADEARRRYEAIVRQNKDPALLEWVGVGMFQTSVFPIPPGARRTVTLRYSQVCRKSQGLTDFLFPLSTAKYTHSPLEKLRVHVAIESKTDIKNVYSASHSVSIERPDDHHATVKYEAANAIPTEDFRLFYDAQPADISASLVSYRPDASKEGYFLLLASPSIEQQEAESQRKTVLFVVDRSGSMSGKKIEQAKGALKFVLNNLREGDLFNIVAYDSEIESFRPELQRFDEDSRTAAQGFVSGIYAGGSTNIDGALARALGMLQDNSQPAYVIFMTDGLPTAGETGEMKIVANAEKANGVRARLFAFGVGYDVNSRLLDKLARASFGQTEYVRPDADIEAAVSRLYRRIGAPVMTDVTLTVDAEDASPAAGPAVSRVYPKGPLDLFAGDQAVIVGRYRASGAAKIKLRGEVGGNAKSLEFPAELAKQSKDDGNSFIAKLWATRRVGEIIDEMDLNGRNEELVKELVDLATKHGILTPYTSFLADENSNVHDVAGNRAWAGRNVADLDMAEGRYAFRQRGAKGALQYARQAPMDASSLAATPRSSGGFGGLGGGFGAGFGGEAARQVSEESLSKTYGKGAVYYDARNDKLAVASNILALGGKTFFRQGDRWVDSTVNEEEAKNAVNVERFGDDYFQLVREHGRRLAPVLAIEEPVCVKIGGRTYTW